jgi:hypothetical protein
MGVDVATTAAMSAHAATALTIERYAASGSDARRPRPTTKYAAAVMAPASARPSPSNAFWSDRMRSPPASTAQPMAAIAMPIPSRRAMPSPRKSHARRPAKIGLVATSATDAAVEVKERDAIHTPKCAASNRPDATHNSSSRRCNLKIAARSRPATAVINSVAMVTLLAATAIAGVGSAQRMRGAAVDTATTASRRKKPITRRTSIAC